MICLGPCGRDGVLCNAEGVCAKCVHEAAVAKAAARSIEKAPDVDLTVVNLCRRGCGQMKHRGRCAGSEAASEPKRAYVRRKPRAVPASDEAGDRPRPERKKASNEADKVRTLRQELQEEFDAVEHRYATLRVKLDTFDEILVALEA